MRGIEESIIAAIKAGESFSGQNTQISHDKAGVSIWLHGHKLASYDGNLTIYPVVYDYPTQTTCNRLNAFFVSIGWQEHKATRRGGKIVITGGKPWNASPEKLRKHAPQAMVSAAYGMTPTSSRRRDRSPNRRLSAYSVTDTSPARWKAGFFIVVWKNQSAFA